MKGKIFGVLPFGRIHVFLSIALAATLTALCVFAARSREARVRAEIGRDATERLGAAERVAAETLREMRERADAVPVEKFEALAAESPASAAFPPDAAVAFAACALASEISPTREFAAYGLAGLGEEKAASLSGAPKRRFSGAGIAESERAEFAREAARFAEARVPGVAALAETAFTKDSSRASAEHPRFGLWFGVFRGSTPESDSYFSGGFRFETRGASVALIREIRAPKIERCIQGLLMNAETLAARLSEKISETFPGARVEIASGTRARTVEGLPLTFSLPPSENALAAERELSAFRAALAVVWLAGTLFVAAFFAAFEHARRAARERRLFSAAVAHDLRVPFARIDAQVAALVRAGAFASPKTLGLAGKLRESVRHFGVFLDNLLLAAKLERADASPPSFPDEDFGTLVEPIFERLEDFLEIFGVDFATEISPAAARARVRVSPVALERIFVNLADNVARTAREDGDVVLTISAHVSAEGRALQIRVADNGGGVSAEARARLFEAFSGTSKSGLGIGLALSRRIARSFGGELRFEKTEAAGTAFLLTLRIEERTSITS